nr:nitroreductase [Sansalvadorimonas sp. 2012CJ34-2]
MTRVSVPVLTEPGPSDCEIDVLIQAACRAPDHARLQPWRFIKITGERRHDLGELLVKAALARGDNLTEGQADRLRKTPLRAPVLLLPVLVFTEHPKVPEAEQLLSLGAAVGNILNTAHILEIGAMWRTGLVSYEPVLAEELGLANNEKLYGFIYLGTPAAEMKSVPEVDPAYFLSDW